jgi:hypothetical protein
MGNISINASVSKTGLLQIPNRKRLQQDLKAFSGCSVEIVIRKKNRRSSPQNRYLWGVVYKELEIRLRDLGNDVDSDTVHDFCKGKFNPKPLAGIGGEKIDDIGGTTTDLTKSEFSEYVDKIIQFAAEYLDITIPLPNTDLQLQF